MEQSHEEQLKLVVNNSRSAKDMVEENQATIVWDSYPTWSYLM